MRLLDCVPHRTALAGHLEWKHPDGQWIRCHHPKAHMVGSFEDRLEASISHRLVCDTLIEVLIQFGSEGRFTKSDLVPMLCSLSDVSRCSQDQN
jgi:hypothetical protein